MISLRTYNLYINGSEIISLHMSNRPNKMTLDSEHIPCIPMVPKRSVHSAHMSNMPIKCYCTNGSEIISLHISNMPNKMLWHTKHIVYIPMVQKLWVCTLQTNPFSHFAHLKQSSPVVHLPDNSGPPDVAVLPSVAATSDSVATYHR